MDKSLTNYEKPKKKVKNNTTTSKKDNIIAIKNNKHKSQKKNHDKTTNYDIDKIIIIQKYWRGYIIRKYILIPQSCYQTKKWRKDKTWYKNGKSNECEKYQVNLINKLIRIKLNKTDDRINFETNKIINKKNPMINKDGYEWSENFDGKIINNNNTYYFNLKFVCDCGGAQTRTLREVNHFITYQLEYLMIFDTKNIYFINILDGDTCYNNLDKFIYLINKKKYKDIIKYVFIGSLYDFQKNKIKYNL
jgi:hypothetical protein